jgi:hypothetical protein
VNSEGIAMSNLTLAIDDDLLRAARIKALQQGTSVNEICREAIARFAAQADDRSAIAAQLVELSRRITSTAPQGQVTANWTSRDEMYDQVMAERMPTLWATLDKK